MNKFDKYKIPIFISLNILVLISLFGMAYAYFKATINNVESASTISIESGELTINYHLVSYQVGQKLKNLPFPVKTQPKPTNFILTIIYIIK